MEVSGGHSILSSNRIPKVSIGLMRSSLAIFFLTTKKKLNKKSVNIMSMSPVNLKPWDDIGI